MMNQVVRWRGMRRGAAVAVAGLAVVLVLGVAAPGLGQARRAQDGATIRDGFEGPVKAWRQEQSDAAMEISLHERTERAAHEGKQSEGFEFRAGIGGGLYYSYAVAPIPVADDLTIGLFIRSNRSGMQLLARVVLPADVDPDSGKPSFVLIPSTTYEVPDRWQKVELADMKPAIERQARVLRAASKRKVSLDGAYVERLIVNVYGGEGVTEVYLDELTVGPVPPEVAEAQARLLRGEPIGPRGGLATALPALPGEDDPDAPAAGRARGGANAPAPNVPGAAERIKFERNRWYKDGYPWFPTMIRGFDVDPTAIRQIGADVAVVPVDANLDYVDTAIQSGLLVLPELVPAPELDFSVAPAPPKPVDPNKLLAEATNFPRKEHVFAWSLGHDLGRADDLDARRAELRKVREAIVALRRAKPGGSPFTTGTVVGQVPEYARIPENLDMLGVPAQSWGTVQGPFETYSYLKQRRDLAARGNNDALFWGEVDVAAPPVYKRMIWGMDRPPEWGIPRVQPEQVRLATYTALAAGYRGLCFKADGDLSQGPGRMIIDEIALLNEEVDLLEPILADPDRTISWLPTFRPDPPKPQVMTFIQQNTSTTNKVPMVKEQPPHPSIQAAAITTKDRRGRLLMVCDFDAYGQYQPAQLAINQLRLRVPAANDALAYLISPGGVRTLASLRVPGGHDITLEDFGVTAIVLMTTNVELKDQIERAVNRVRPFAISLAIEQAELQRAWVAEIDAKLQAAGHAQKDTAELFAAADKLIQSARDALAREDYPTAWEEARRVGRPLRILMRYHFIDAYDSIIKALKDEDLPCGPTRYDGQKKPQARLIAPIVAAPLVSFNTLPQAWQWLDWIKTGRLGKNAVPDGDFNSKAGDDFWAAGWARVAYQSDELQTEITLPPGGPDNLKQQKGQGNCLTLKVKPRAGVAKLDQLPPFMDHPVVAARSPAVPVRAGEMYRVSVMIHSMQNTAPGAGGLIVRDNFGGERLQYRLAQAADDWFEVVYYRRIPADGELAITLGYAAIAGACQFDDLRVEPIVEQISLENRPVAVRPRPDAETTPNPDGTRPRAEPVPNRAAFRAQPVPIRE